MPFGYPFSNKVNSCKLMWDFVFLLQTDPPAGVTLHPFDLDALKVIRPNNHNSKFDQLQLQLSLFWSPVVLFLIYVIFMNI